MKGCSRHRRKMRKDCIACLRLQNKRLIMQVNRNRQKQKDRAHRRTIEEEGDFLW